jgi:hypothetical protein
LSETTEVTFKLVEGDGPVHLITSKILGKTISFFKNILLKLFFGFKEPPFDFGGYSSDDEDQFDGMSVTSDEDIPQNAGDRKAQVISAGKSSKKSKKQQIGSTNSNTNNNNSSELQQQKKKRKKDE